MARGCRSLVHYAIMASEGSGLPPEGLTAAALDPDVFLRQVRDRCLNRHIQVRALHHRFRLFLYKSPDNPDKCLENLVLMPGQVFVVDAVELSKDGERASGRTTIEDCEGNQLWVNLRSRLNSRRELRPTWYVEVASQPQVLHSRERPL